MRISESNLKEIVFALVALLVLFAPIDFLIKVVVGLLATFTPLLKLTASKKRRSWTLLSFLWCDFFEPLFRIQLIAIGFLALAPVETITVWGIPIYLAVIPVVVLILKRWLTRVCERVDIVWS